MANPPPEDATQAQRTYADVLIDAGDTPPFDDVECNYCGQYLPPFAMLQMQDQTLKCTSCYVAEYREAEPPYVYDLNDLRSERAARLAACDWTQLSDVPEETRLLWQPYRQALRDLPDTVADVNNVVWPEPPSISTTQR